MEKDSNKKVEVTTTEMVSEDIVEVVETIEEAAEVVENNQVEEKALNNVKEDETSSQDSLENSDKTNNEDELKDKAKESFSFVKNNMETTLSSFIPFAKLALKNPDNDSKVDNKTVLMTLVGWAVVMGITLSLAITKFVNTMLSLVSSLSSFSYGSSSYMTLKISHSVMMFIRIAIFHLLAYAAFIAIDWAMSKLILKNTEDTYLTVARRYIKYLVPVTCVSLVSMLLLIINLNTLGLIGIVIAYTLLSIGNIIVLTKTEKFQEKSFSKTYYAAIVLILFNLLMGLLAGLFNIF